MSRISFDLNTGKEEEFELPQARLSREEFIRLKHIAVEDHSTVDRIIGKVISNWLRRQKQRTIAI